MSLHHLPNALTVLRLALTPPVVAAILMDAPTLALALFIVASASDGLDGLLARRYGWRTPLGAVLDPVADKLLITLTCLALSITGSLPVWFFALVLARDVFIAGGALAWRRQLGPLRMEPLAISKLTTLLVFASIVVTLLPWPTASARAEGVEGLLLLTTVCVVASGAAYGLIWGARAHSAIRSASVEGHHER